jgi:hypothetical protein
MKTTPTTQIPLMGIKKLGTKGSLLLHYYNGEPMFSLSFYLFRKIEILMIGLFRKIQEKERKGENFVLTKLKPPRVPREP